MWLDLWICNYEMECAVWFIYFTLKFKLIKLGAYWQILKLFEKKFELFDKLLSFLTGSWAFWKRIELFERVLSFSKMFWAFWKSFDLFERVLSFLKELWAFWINFERILGFLKLYWTFCKILAFCLEIRISICIDLSIKGFNVVSLIVKIFTRFLFSHTIALK